MLKNPAVTAVLGGLVVAIGATGIAHHFHRNAAASSVSSSFPGDQGLSGARALPESLPMALALEAAQTAVAACEGNHVGVSIIDAAGTPKLYYMPDGTDGVNAYAGFRKAWSALTFKMPTSQVGELAKSDPSVAARLKADPNLMIYAGGLPLTSAGKIIGALGVSGSVESAKDEECGRQGIAKIQDRLK